MAMIKWDKNITKKGWGIYSVAFIVTALFCYVLFIIKGETLIKFGSSNVDGLTQVYPAYVAVKHMIQGLFNGDGIAAWNWSLGMGGDSFEYFGSKLLNPLTYLIILFPDDRIDLGYTIATILRQYLAGLTFYLCMREEKLGWKQSVVGALSYAFSGWVFGTALNQGSFANAAVVLPLLIMGAEWIFKKKTPTLFILSVAFCLTCGVTWTFICGVVVVAYFFARYRDYHSGQSFANLAKDFGEFVLYGIDGILIASPFLLSILCSMTAATTDTGANNRVLAFAIEKYLSIPEGLFRAVEVGAVSYSYICMSIICVLLLPMIILQAKKKDTIAWIAIVLSVAAMFPITSSIFNGLSYPAGRWYFVLAFFIIWACMKCLNKDTFTKKNILVMAAWLAFLVAWVAIMFVLGIGSKGAVIAAASGGFWGALMLASIYVYCYKCHEEKSRKLLEGFAGLVLIGAIACSCNIKLLGGDYIDDYLELESAAVKIGASSERAVAELYAEDDGFYRTDLSYRLNSELHSKMRANSNLVYGNRSVYAYSSLIDSKWNEFCKVIGNNYGCFARLAVMSNDNRAYADFLTGVKYYLGSNIFEETASQYAGYDFDTYKTINGVDVLKSNYSIGLGAPFDSYITQSELLSIPTLLRDQAMLQVAVIPDDQADKLSGIAHADVSELKTDSSKIKCEIKAGANAELDTEAKTIAVSGGDGQLIIDCEKANNCQLVVSFEGLERASKTYEEHLELDNLKPAANSIGEAVDKSSYRDRGAFTITARKGGIKKYSYCEKDSTRGFNDIESFNINMGYYDSTEGTIEISLSETGTYTYENICVYAIPMDVYDEYAAQLDASKMQLTEWDDDFLSGNVKAEEDSVLYLAIPYKKGWTARVDGEEAEIINTDIAFSGVLIPAGTHSVELEYSHWGMKAALAASLAGVMMLVAILLRRRKEQSEQAAA